MKTTEKTFRFPRVDTVVNGLVVGGMAVASICLVVMQGAQSIVA